MLGNALSPLLMLALGTALFMVAGLLVCIAISIFTDTINLGGAFDGVAEKIIAVVFVPLLLAAQLIDVIISFFVPANIKQGMNSKVEPSTKSSSPPDLIEQEGTPPGI